MLVCYNASLWISSLHLTFPVILVCVNKRSVFYPKDAESCVQTVKSPPVQEYYCGNENICSAHKQLVSLLHFSKMSFKVRCGGTCLWPWYLGETGGSLLHVPEQPGPGAYSEFQASQNCIERPSLFYIS